jgi:hypothetical protein
MMKLFLNVSVLAVLAGFFALPALAIDQVRLTNGQVVEGTVLNDMTNLYVDIRLVNGDTKRIPHSEVASVDRDVPSRKDRDVLGNQSLGFFGVNLGGFYNTDNPPGSSVLFDYGVRVGFITGQVGDTKFGFGLSFDRASSSQSIEDETIHTHYNDINLQMLFMRIANSGFYFGPNVGLSIVSGTDDIGGVSDAADLITQTRLEAGAEMGYEAYLSDSFAIGPDVRYDHIFGSDYINVLKFTMGGTLHF